jgi:hypothetical protein
MGGHNTPVIIVCNIYKSPRILRFNKCSHIGIKKAALMAALTLLVLHVRGKGNGYDRLVTSYHEYAGNNERTTKIAFHYAVPAYKPLHRSPPVIIRQTQALEDPELRL